MQRKQRPEANEEPAVTFELDEAQPARRRSHLGAAGTAAIAGAGLAAGGATPEMPDSLDVFEQVVEGDPIGDVEGAIPTTSFSELAGAAADPEFPAIEFSPPVDAGETLPASAILHGALGAVGGGFRLEHPSGAEALAAPDVALEPLSESLLEYPETDDGASLDDSDPDDLDLN